jgi:hypothetical protein
MLDKLITYIVCWYKTLYQVLLVEWTNLQYDHDHDGPRSFGSFIYIYIIQLRIDRSICSIHEEITSIKLYTQCNSHSGLRKGVYSLIEVISNEPNK